MKYSLILQNTISREISIYNLEDNSTGVYYQFEIELKDEKDGEYEYILFQNEKELPVKIFENNAFKSEVFVPTILVTYNDTLTSNTAVMCTADASPIEVLSFGLMTIGDYDKKNLTYNKKSNYTVYERN